MRWFGLAALGLVSCSSNALAASDNDQSAAVQAIGNDAPVQADSSSIEFSTGFDYSTGKYGAAADTSVKSAPLEAKAQLGRLRLQASLPYVWIKGPGQVVGGVVVGSNDPSAVASRDGLGDLSLGAAYRLTNESGALPVIELGTTTKLPTANQTIGTGKADYGVNVAMFKSLSPSTTLFGSVGYSWLGSPAAYRLNNGVAAYGGINIRPDAAINLGVSASYREPVADGLQGQAAVAPYVTYRISKKLGLTGYTTVGLNNASPRIGAGVRLTLFQ